MKGTHNLEVTVQFSLKVGTNEDDVLDLNTVHYKASLEVYDNRLDSMTVNDFIVNINSQGNQIKFPSDSDDADGLSIAMDRYDRYVWYAVGLPDGLTIADGVISGMPVESTKQNGENDPTEVLIVVRGTVSSNPTNVSETEGREYYGTLSINVWGPLPNPIRSSSPRLIPPRIRTRSCSEATTATWPSTAPRSS